MLDVADSELDPTTFTSNPVCVFHPTASPIEVPPPAPILLSMPV